MHVPLRKRSAENTGSACRRGGAPRYSSPIGLELTITTTPPPHPRFDAPPGRQRDIHIGVPRDDVEHDETVRGVGAEIVILTVGGAAFILAGAPRRKTETRT